MSTSLLSKYQEEDLSGLTPALRITEKEISSLPDIGLFIWTLTHQSRAFTEIQPVFKSREELLNCVSGFAGERLLLYSETSLSSSKIFQIALAKINREWNAWVRVHEDLQLDEHKLDNMLMAALYRIILDRDRKKCVLCQAQTGLTIHHIIQKRRNIVKVAPPFGRSVPTNLLTLCRKCHAGFDPMILA